MFRVLYQTLLSDETPICRYSYKFRKQSVLQHDQNMVRSVVRSMTQPLVGKEDSRDVQLVNTEECKSIRCSLSSCMRSIGYTFGAILLLWFVSSKLNSIEPMVSNLRAAANRLFVNNFQLESSAFKDGQPIPSKYNSTLSPSLQWSQPPLLTRSFVLIVENLDTLNHFKHWIVYNIPSNVNALSEGILVWPDGTVVIRNDDGHYRYDGPSPRDGRIRHYVFRLVALRVAKLDLPKGDDGASSYKSLKDAMEPFILAEKTLIGTYNYIDHD